MGWERARLPFPLERCSGQPPPTLGTHPVETSAGLGTGPAPGNPLQVGRSQQAWRPQVRKTPSLTAQLSVPCALHLFSPRENGGLERAGPWPESHGKITAEWEIKRALNRAFRPCACWHVLLVGCSPALGLFCSPPD